MAAALKLSTSDTLSDKETDSKALTQSESTVHLQTLDMKKKVETEPTQVDTEKTETTTTSSDDLSAKETISQIAQTETKEALPVSTRQIKHSNGTLPPSSHENERSDLNSQTTVLTETNLTNKKESGLRKPLAFSVTSRTPIKMTNPLKASGSVSKQDASDSDKNSDLNARKPLTFSVASRTLKPIELKPNVLKLTPAVLKSKADKTSEPSTETKSNSETEIQNSETQAKASVKSSELNTEISKSEVSTEPSRSSDPSEAKTTTPKASDSLSIEKATEKDAETTQAERARKERNERLAAYLAKKANDVKLETTEKDTRKPISFSLPARSVPLKIERESPVINTENTTSESAVSGNEINTNLASRRPISFAVTSRAVVKPLELKTEVLKPVPRPEPVLLQASLVPAASTSMSSLLSSTSQPSPQLFNPQLFNPVDTSMDSEQMEDEEEFIIDTITRIENMHSGRRGIEHTINREPEPVLNTGKVSTESMSMTPRGREIANMQTTTELSAEVDDDFVIDTITRVEIEKKQSSRRHSPSREARRKHKERRHKHREEKQKHDQVDSELISPPPRSTLPPSDPRLRMKEEKGKKPGEGQRETVTTKAECMSLSPHSALLSHSSREASQSLSLTLYVSARFLAVSHSCVSKHKAEEREHNQRNHTGHALESQTGDTAI